MRCVRRVARLRESETERHLPGNPKNGIKYILIADNHVATTPEILQCSLATKHTSECFTSYFWAFSFHSKAIDFVESGL